MKFRRNFSRAPLSQSVLFESSKYIFTATSLNISGGGIFLNHLPFVPADNKISIMLNIPQIPSFKRIVEREELSHRLQFFNVKTIRVKVEIMRSTVENSTLGPFLGKGIGCKFLDLSAENLNIINRYVKGSSKNIKYLLRLFEEATELDVNEREDSFKTLLYLAQILDHDKNTKPSLIRNKLLSDYQSFF